MPVYDQSYQHWDGRLRPGLLRWLPMVRYHVRLLMQRKIVWLLLFMSLVPAMIFSVFIYISSQRGAETGMPLELPLSVLQNVVADGELANIGGGTLAQKYHVVTRYGLVYFLIYFQSFIVLMITSVVGAGLIARDVKSNALEIYLTKPITAADYVFGKLAVISVFVFLVTFVPSILIYLVASALWEGFFTATWMLLLPLLGSCLVAALVNGFVILGLSSLAKSARYATVIWFALCFISAMTGNILAALTTEPRFYFVSYRGNFEVICNELFGGGIMIGLDREPLELSIVGPVVVLSSLVVASILIMRQTIRAVENR